MARNPEKAKAYQKAYYEANREKRGAYGRAWCEANREKKTAYNEAYYEANREKMAEHSKAKAASLTSSYVCGTLRLPVKEIPPELIELKRLSLQLKRELKNGLNQNC